jgi:hypothetical protein
MEESYVVAGWIELACCVACSIVVRDHPVVDVGRVGKEKQTKRKKEERVESQEEATGTVNEHVWRG